MRVCIPAVGSDMESKICPIFGRTPYFVFVEVNEGNISSWNSEKNPAEYARGGAGIMAAQKVVDAGCKAVIAISIGPKAYDLLRAAGIKIYRGFEASIRENVEKMIRNELEEFIQPVPGRFGRGGRGFGRRGGWW